MKGILYALGIFFLAIGAAKLVIALYVRHKERTDG